MQDIRTNKYFLFVYDTLNQLEYQIAHIDDSIWYHVVEEYHLSLEEIEQMTLFFLKNIILKNTNNQFIERT